MNEKINIVSLKHENRDLSPVDKYGKANAEKVINFHKSFPEYKETPLVSLDNLAKQLGVNNIYIKDESYRFGLNAFKVLGGSYAIGRYIAKKLNKDISELPYEKMVSKEVKDILGDITFVTATDGNHGRGVAWTANRLKQKSVVYMPKGSAQERLDNIKALGSDAFITDLNYDDAVRLANESQNKYGWVLVQDTAFKGYTNIPGWIMEGYTTMAHEAAKQLQEEKPTHIFLQAGVGAMAGAVTAYFADLYKEERPIIIIVEPDKADCIYRTAKANDGKLHFVTDDMNSMMAGLCCGEPCSIAWDILKDHADYFVSMPDYVSAKGMRTLAWPIGNDQKVVSGESGAATLGLVVEIMQNKDLIEIKNKLQLDKNSKILCFSTEGDTDKQNYQRIINDETY